jgi:hypothetical protein
VKPELASTFTYVPAKAAGAATEAVVAARAIKVLIISFPYFRNESNYLVRLTLRNPDTARVLPMPIFLLAVLWVIL